MNLRRLRYRFYRKRGGPRMGLRCKAFNAGCLLCQSYRFLDTYGRFPRFDEVAPLCEAAV